MQSLLGSKDKSIIYPEHADIVIIGGGFIGSAIAYWLKKRTGEGLTVVVLEKDFTVSSKLICQKISNIILVTQPFFINFSIRNLRTMYL